MTLDELKALVQQVVDGVNALELPAAAPTITDVKVDESDGTEEDFTPKA